VLRQLPSSLLSNDPRTCFYNQVWTVPDCIEASSEIVVEEKQQQLAKHTVLSMKFMKRHLFEPRVTRKRPGEKFIKICETYLAHQDDSLMDN
jgi:hypothetical protein